MPSRLIRRAGPPMHCRPPRWLPSWPRPGAPHEDAVAVDADLHLALVAGIDAAGPRPRRLALLAALDVDHRQAAGGVGGAAVSSTRAPRRQADVERRMFCGMPLMIISSSDSAMNFHQLMVIASRRRRGSCARRRRRGRPAARGRGGGVHRPRLYGAAAPTRCDSCARSRDEALQEADRRCLPVLQVGQHGVDAGWRQTNPRAVLVDRQRRDQRPRPQLSTPTSSGPAQGQRRGP